MDIVGKIELISESETLLSMGNIIAIIVAVISLTGVIISTVWTNIAATAISIIPVLLIYLFFQKQFIAGIAASAVKG